MSWRARERKRKMRKSQEVSKASAVRTGSSSKRYWLTVVTTKTCCASCGGILVIGGEMVYRHVPRESLCVPCATSARIFYRPSLRWERSKERRT